MSALWNLFSALIAANLVLSTLTMKDEDWLAEQYQAKYRELCRKLDILDIRHSTFDILDNLSLKPRTDFLSPWAPVRAKNLDFRTTEDIFDLFTPS